LTKDGNRSADSVISSNLAWNPWVKSVDSYEFLNGTLAQYVDDYLLGMISQGVINNEAYGFFTDRDFSATDVETATAQAIVDVCEAAVNVAKAKATAFDINGNPTQWDETTGDADKAAYDAAVADLEAAYEAYAEVAIANTNIFNWDGKWFDGLRVVTNNFKGTILGGKNAVSKDKAKQLDDTVKDSILKINDGVANTNSGSITINGKTYHTISWLNEQTASLFSTIGVDGIGNTKKTFTVDEVIAVPYDYFNVYGVRYLYQPVGLPEVEVISYKTSAPEVAVEQVTIKMAKFDAQATNWNSLNNSYTGYGFVGYGTLTLNYDFVNGNYSAYWSAD
jgi:hypothetical protein